MPFYRYAIETENQYTRSLIPFGKQIKEFPFFSYRFYTSQNESSPDFRVISIGHERSWPEKLRVQTPGSINRFNLRYVINGEGNFCGQQVSKGDFFFNLPYDEYVISNTVPFEYYYIGVAGNGTEALLKSVGFYNIPKIGKCSFLDQISKLFEDALFVQHPTQAVEYYLLSLFMTLMFYHKSYNAELPQHPTDHTYVYYQQALNYIREYLFEGITPRDIAAFLHLSPSYLRSVFAKHCEYSLQEYLIRTRINIASNKLLQTGCTVKAAANAVGYSDVSLFSKLFKKYMGVAPLIYQTENKAIETNERHEGS